MLPLSFEAFEEFQEFQMLCDEHIPLSLQNDSMTFFWGKDVYSSANFYKYMFQSLPKDKTLSKVWKSTCLLKLKVFCWLLLKDRLNTKDMMDRKHWHVEGGSNCVLCDDGNLERFRESLFHVCLCHGVLANGWSGLGLLVGLSPAISICFG